jgi:hypothetical protein
MMKIYDVRIRFDPRRVASLDVIEARESDAREGPILSYFEVLLLFLPST